MTTPSKNRLAAELPVWQPPKPSAVVSAAGEGPEFDAAKTTSDGEIPEEAALEPAAVQTSPAHVRARARRGNSTTVLLVLSAMVALGGLSFAVGRVTSSGGTSQTTANSANGAQNGLPGFDANASGAPGLRPDGFGGPDSATATVSGTVVAVTADSITIQEANGRTVTIATGSSTAYHSQTSASAADVTTGVTVTVQTSATLTGTGSATASASPGTVTRTATDVTITGK